MRRDFLFLLTGAAPAGAGAPRTKCSEALTRLRFEYPAAMLRGIDSPCGYPEMMDKISHTLCS